MYAESLRKDAKVHFLTVNIQGTEAHFRKKLSFSLYDYKIIDECACLAHNLVCCMSLKINRIIKVHIAAKNKLISLETNKIKGKTALFKLHKTCLHF